VSGGRFYCTLTGGAGLRLGWGASLCLSHSAFLLFFGHFASSIPSFTLTLCLCLVHLSYSATCKVVSGHVTHQIKSNLLYSPVPGDADCGVPPSYYTSSLALTFHLVFIHSVSHPYFVPMSCTSVLTAPPGRW
jgi:hypothetical protein